MKTNKNFKGKLIVFEGVDGAGKTTLLNALKKELEKHFEVKKVKMPSMKTKQNKMYKTIEKNINNYKTSDEFLNLNIFILGDKLLLLNSQVLPALVQGKIVLCDRYAFTNIARCPNKLTRQIAKKFVKPHLVVLCDASPQNLKTRVLSRKNEKHKSYDDEFVLFQKQNFEALKKQFNFYKLNTDGKVKSTKKQLFEIVWQLLNKWSFYKIIKKWWKNIKKQAKNT